MDAFGLTVGSKLELELYDNNGKQILPVLVSQFESLLPDGTMVILAPISEGRIYPVHYDTMMDVIYERDDHLYKFQAVALNRKVSGNIYLLRIKPLTDEVRFQRRTFFRINCLLDIRYRPADRNTGKKDVKAEFKSAVTKDLSGGGMGILLNEKPDRGSIVEGIVNVGREVHFLGRIVRINSVTDRGTYGYEAGIEFTEIASADRERIIRFIFGLQRNLLHKGWQTK